MILNLLNLVNRFDHCAARLQDFNRKIRWFLTDCQDHGIKKTMAQKTVSSLNEINDTAGDVHGIRWIVNDSQDDDRGELGFKVGPLQFWYYKWSDPMITFDVPYRIAQKREFGESIVSPLFQEKK